MVTLILILIYLVPLFLIHLVGFILWNSQAGPNDTTIGDMYNYYINILDIDASMIFFIYIPLFNIIIAMFVLIVLIVQMLSTIKLR